MYIEITNNNIDQFIKFAKEVSVTRDIHYEDICEMAKLHHLTYDINEQLNELRDDTEFENFISQLTTYLIH